MERKGHPGSPQLRPEAQSTTNEKAVYSRVEQNARGKPIRRLFSLQTLLQFIADTLLVIPPLLFIIYGFLVLHYDGRPSDTKVVRELLSAAKYGPTIFPIIFAAIAGSFLKTVASWKLERGISVLSLEYLLSSRTVFSAVTTPISLRAFNLLTPFLLALWAFSPLGGQAAIRITVVVPNRGSLPWDFSYLDYNSPMRYQHPRSAAGEDIISTVVGTFTSALLATPDTKLGAMDTFGNLKIPMVEACRSGGALPDSDGWYNSLPGAGCNYSSLIGLPAVPRTATGSANTSFVLETMYMFTDCKLDHWPAKGQDERLGVLNNTGRYGGPYANSVGSFGIWFLDEGFHFREGPQHLVFTSFSYDTVTNASCTLTTTYVEAHAFCHNSDCKVDRVRESTHPRNRTTLTVLDYITPYPGYGAPIDGYFTAFSQAADTAWDIKGAGGIYSTPIEYYFTHPESPYSAAYDSSIGMRGADIYPIGDAVFSQRFSQLLNTFWISSIAPDGVLGYFNVSADGQSASGYAALNVTGEVTPDYLVLECRRGWLAILVIASMTMLFAATATAILGLLRRGPDILDRASLILRDNPYVNVPAASSMENGYEQARRLKDVQLCLGDARSGLERGHVAIGTMDAVTPLSHFKADGRLY
jgi:hypothetical protein